MLPSPCLHWMVVVPSRLFCIILFEGGIPCRRLAYQLCSRRCCLALLFYSFPGELAPQ